LEPHSLYIFAVKDTWHAQYGDKLCSAVVEIHFCVQTFVLDEGDIVQMSGQFLIGNRGQVSFLVLLNLNLDLPDFTVLGSSSILVILTRASDDEHAIHRLSGV